MKGILLVFIAAALWALDTLIRYPLLYGGVSAERIVLMEHILLVVVLFPVFWTVKARFWEAKVSHIFAFIVIGGLGSAFSTLCFTEAFSLINPSLVILLQKLQPIVAITLAAMFLGEKIQTKFLYWAMLCLVGGFLVSYRDISAGLGSGSFWNQLFSATAFKGYGLTLLAVIGWGSSTVFGKKLSMEGYSEKEIMVGRFTMGLLALLPWWYYRGFSLGFEPMTWGKVAIMVLLSGILAMYFYYLGLKRISAKVCALAETFFPFCAIVLNWVFLGKTLDNVQLVGGALLVLGSTVIQLKRY